MRRSSVLHAGPCLIGIFGACGNAPATADGEGAIPQCETTPERSAVHGIFALGCLAETFDVRAKLSDIRWAAAGSSEIGHASFELMDEVGPSIDCSSPQTLSYRGVAPPSLQIGAAYRLQAWFNRNDPQHADAIVALRDEADVLLVGGYWQSTDHLDVPFAPELGLSLAAVAECRSRTDTCFASYTYNALAVTREGHQSLLHIGESLDIESGGGAYSLGLNGGSHRERPVMPSCFDIRPGSDAIFTIVRR